MTSVPPSRGNSPSAVPRPRPDLSVWLLLVLGLLSLYCAAVLAGMMPFRVLREYQATTVEPQTVAAAMWVAKGEPLYRDFRVERPMVAITYGPLFYSLPGWMGRLAGRADALFLLHAGRTVTALSSLATILLMFALARLHRVPWRWSWVAVLPLFWFPELNENWTKFVPHQTALCLSLAGWVLALQGRRRRGGHRIAFWIAAGLVWTAGFLYHPTALVGPIAWLFGSVRWRKRLGGARRPHVSRGTLVPLIVYAGLSLLAMLILHLSTDGLWKLSTVDSQAIFEHHPANIWTNIENLGRAALVILAGMLALAVARWRWPLFGTFLILFTLESLLMMKQGSGASYLLGSLALWGVAFAVLVARTKPAQRLRPDLLLATLVLIAGVAWNTRTAEVPSWEVPIPSTEEIRMIDNFLGGRFDSPEVLYLEPFYAQLHEQPFPYAEPYHASIFSIRGGVDFSDVAEGLRARRYSAVIANLMYLADARYHGVPAVPPVIREALLENYQPVLQQGQLPDWLVPWVPK